MNVKHDNPLAVGALVARFQVHELHPAHKELIEYVCAQHDKVLIVLGLAPTRGTTNNPLDLQARSQMVREAFPDVDVAYIEDQAEDAVWSRKLDEVIRHHTTPNQTVMLYGGRDSFISHYSGKFPTQELESDVVFSGTVLREEVSRRSVRKTADFRAGAVWQAFNRFPVSYPTVDVGVWKGDKLLLVRKADETLWRLPGGFAEPNSETYEQDARREVAEEAGISITDPAYVYSLKIDDWRYRNEVDKIKTLLFTADYQFGHLEPQDVEIAEAGWFDLVTSRTKHGFLKLEMIVPIHHPLVERLVSQRQRKIGD
jgi:bifunctional NMN adenylyltransferase/nudix hydrolase